jgi:hypothetical protein
VVDRRDHWQGIYASASPDQVSWYEPLPVVSLRLVRGTSSPSASVIDVGSGESTLVDELIGIGYADLTLLDISSTALHEVHRRLGDAASTVRFIEGDVLCWKVDRTFDVWHDRAVLHFLTTPDERAQYVRVASEAVAARGVIVLATFAEDGPDRCSGLPVRRYSADALAGLFPAFDLLHSERVEHLTPNGTVQPFTYVVLQR